MTTLEAIDFLSKNQPFNDDRHMSQETLEKVKDFIDSLKMDVLNDARIGPLLFESLGDAGFYGRRDMLCKLLAEKFEHRNLLPSIRKGILSSSEMIQDAAISVVAYSGDRIFIDVLRDAMKSNSEILIDSTRDALADIMNEEDRNWIESDMAAANDDLHIEAYQKLLEQLDANDETDA